MSFAQFNLNPKINQAISLCGYTNPTPIQEQTIPVILQGNDVIACAQTGTGKTAAFMLPTLCKLAQIQQKQKQTQILILTPTRELASQILQAATTYGKFLRFNMVSLIGGMPFHQQIKKLKAGAEIIIATPGRLIDHIQNKRVDLSQVKTLILDEADRMLDMGFIEDIEFISGLTPRNRQTLLFSATIDSQLKNIIRKLMNNPTHINLSHEKVTAPKIKQELYRVQNIGHKTQLLKHFLNEANVYKAIIFSATKINADKLTRHLREQGFSVAALHGDLKQSVRYRTLDQLKSGKIQYLIATDVAARGIDINDISHVINYDLPRFCEDYVHRIGRTGRAGKDGIAISFVLPSDAKHLQRIERYIGQRLKVNHIDDLHHDVSTMHEKSKSQFDEPAQDADNNKHWHKKQSAKNKSSKKNKNNRFRAKNDRLIRNKKNKEKVFNKKQQ